MKISNDILEKINKENLKAQMIESFRMGSGLKDQIINKLISGEEVSLPKELEAHLNGQLPIWFNKNLERKNHKKIVA